MSRRLSLSPPLQWRSSTPALACLVAVALALGFGAGARRLQGHAVALPVPQLPKVNVTPATLPWPAVVAPERLIPPTSLASAEAPDAANPPSGAVAPEIDIHLAPPRRGTPLAIAHAAWWRGDWATARTAYLAARAQTPRLAEPELGLAALALREGASAVAASHYHAALRLDPTNPIARIGLLSETPASVGRRDLAQESRNPRELAHFHYALGRAAAAALQWARARQAFAQALALSASPDYAVALAVALDHLGLETEAAGYYRRALADWSAARAGFDPAPIRLRLQALNAEF